MADAVIEGGAATSSYGPNGRIVRRGWKPRSKVARSDLDRINHVARHDACGERGAMIQDRWLVLGFAVILAGAFPVAPFATIVGATAAAAVLVATRRLEPGAALLSLALFAFAASRADFALGRASVVYEAARRVVSPPAKCSGVVAIESSPVVRGGELVATARFESGRCSDRDASGLVATLAGFEHGTRRADRVALDAELALVQRFQNDGSFNKLTRIARTGAAASGRVRAARLVERQGGLGALVDVARAHVRDRIEATYHPDARALGRALVLGETDLDREVDEAFRVTGLSHLLAVSGTHLVIAVLGLVSMLRAILVRFAFVAARWDASRIAAFAAIGLSWLYADFAGGGGSVFRAAAMVSAASAARALGRRPSGPRCFAASLLAGAGADPMAVLDLSFALSAAATVGLMTLATPIARVMGAPTDDATGLFGSGSPPSAAPGALRRMWGALATSMATTLGATLACAPIILSVSPTLPAAGVPANVIAAPLGETFALPFALVHTALAFVPPIEQGAAFVAGGALRAVLVVARVARDTGAVLPAPPPTALEVACAGVALLAVIAARRRAVSAFALAFGVVGLVALELRARREGAPEALLRMSVLDVGQGDAVALDMPDGSFMLVDGGGIPASSFDVGERVLAPVLRARRRSRIDVAVISHPHPDHYAGLVTTLERMPVGELWDTGEVEREGPAHGDMARILTSLRARSVPVVRPSALCEEPRWFGRAMVETLAPCPGPDPALSTNDASFVLRVRYGARAILLAGDLEREGEERLLETAPERLRADVLKVGHHGSKTSTSDAFLRAVAPRFAAISCGVRNRFGHPAPSVLATLDAHGVRIARTDTGGEWRYWTDGDREWVNR